MIGIRSEISRGVVTIGRSFSVYGWIRPEYELMRSIENPERG